MKGIVIDIDIQESFSYSLMSPPVSFKPIDKTMECDLAFFFSLFSSLLCFLEFLFFSLYSLLPFLPGDKFWDSWNERL